MKEVHTINHIPICDQTARDTIANHDHDEKYSNKSHVHDDRYADINHTHKDCVTKETVQNIVNNSIADIPTPDIDLSEYAKKSEIPVRVSQLKNNVYYVTTSELSSKEFQALKTKNKTIIGAINELYDMIIEIKDDVSDIPQTPTTAPCTDVTLTMASLNLIPSQIVDLAAYITPSNCTDKITWTSSNSNVATVTNISEQKVGRIQAVAAGTCTITVKCGKYSDTCLVTVQSSATGSDEVLCTGITLDKTSTVYLYEGQTYQFKATTSPSACTQRTYWLSSNATIASVSSTGLVTAKSPGNAIIMATCGDYTASCEVHVSAETDTIDASYEKIRILTGAYRTMVLTDNEELWSCGHYTEGMLGYEDHNYKDIRQFTKITTGAINDIKEMCGGSAHTILFKENGQFSATGDNEFYQLGKTSNKYDNLVFTNVNTITNIKKIYSNGSSTIVLKNDGTLWGIGVGTSGELGLGTTGNKSSWTQITTNVGNINRIFCGSRSMFMIKNDGTLWACGADDGGKLGLGLNSGDVKSFQKVQITGNIGNALDIKDISFGGNHTVILKNDGTVWGAGWDTGGELGLSNDNLGNRTSFTKLNIDNVKRIQCGSTYTMVLKNDGTLWATGHNDCGQFGLGYTSDESKFIKITMNVDNVVDIACGDSCSFVIKSNGEIWACGDNRYGQLGLNSTTEKILTFTRTNLKMNGSQSAAPIPCESISIDKKEITLSKGNRETLTVTLYPVSTTDTVLWSSDDNSIATVNQDGIVTAVKAGTTFINVHCGNKSDFCKIIVS